MKHFALTLFAVAAMSVPSLAQAPARTISASANKLNVEQLQGESQNVQLSRYFFAGYNTLCLPMSLTAEQLSAAANGLTVERLTAIHQEDNVLNLYFVDCTAEGIEAGVPYLVYSPTSQFLRARKDNALRIDDGLKAVRMSDGEGNTVTFSSSWEAMTKEGRYGIPAQQDVTPLESVLVRTEGDKTFLPTRCGFSWDQQSSTASELRICHAPSMAEVNAIVGVEKTQTAVDTYDLSGRKVMGNQKKGIYVVGGEKVIK